MSDHFTFLKLPVKIYRWLRR